MKTKCDKLSVQAVAQRYSFQGEEYFRLCLHIQDSQQNGLCDCNHVFASHIPDMRTANLIIKGINDLGISTMETLLMSFEPEDWGNRLSRLLNL